MWNYKFCGENPKEAKGQEHYYHWWHCPSSASHCACQGVEDGKKEVEGTEKFRGEDSCCNYIRLLSEKGNDPWRKLVEHGARYNCVDDSHKKGCPHSLLHPVNFACPVVLPSKGCYGKA